MRYFLDAEFNGFGGQLISLALVPEDPEAASFYETLACADPNPWVIDHVVPVLQKQPISRPEMIARLAAYLLGDSEPEVTADWPDDVAQKSRHHRIITKPWRSNAKNLQGATALWLPIDFWGGKRAQATETSASRIGSRKPASR